MIPPSRTKTLKSPAPPSTCPAVHSVALLPHRFLRSRRNWRNMSGTSGEAGGKSLGKPLRLACHLASVDNGWCSNSCKVDLRKMLQKDAKDNSTGAGDGSAHNRGYSFVACLSPLTVNHASLSRRSTGRTPNGDTSNAWALVTFLPYIVNSL